MSPRLSAVESTVNATPEPGAGGAGGKGPGALVGAGGAVPPEPPLPPEPPEPPAPPWEPESCDPPEPSGELPLESCVSWLVFGAVMLMRQPGPDASKRINANPRVGALFAQLHTLIFCPPQPSRPILPRGSILPRSRGLQNVS